MPMAKRAAVRMNTPEEEADIQRGIDADPDTFELTDGRMAEMRSAGEVMPPAAYAELVERRRRGPQRTPVKEMISLRLDRDVLESLRASGPGWQRRANEMLRKAVLG